MSRERLPTQPPRRPYEPDVQPHPARRAVDGYDVDYQQVGYGDHSSRGSLPPFSVDPSGRIFSYGSNDDGRANYPSRLPPTEIVRDYGHTDPGSQYDDGDVGPHQQGFIDDETWRGTSRREMSTVPRQRYPDEMTSELLRLPVRSTHHDRLIPTEQPQVQVDRYGLPVVAGAQRSSLQTHTLEQPYPVKGRSDISKAPMLEVDRYGLPLVAAAQRPSVQIQRRHVEQEPPTRSRNYLPEPSLANEPRGNPRHLDDIPSDPVLLELEAARARAVLARHQEYEERARSSALQLSAAETPIHHQATHRQSHYPDHQTVLERTVTVSSTVHRPEFSREATSLHMPEIRSSLPDEGVGRHPSERSTGQDMIRFRKAWDSQSTSAFVDRGQIQSRTTTSYDYLLSTDEDNQRLMNTLGGVPDKAVIRREREVETTLEIAGGADADTVDAIRQLESLLQGSDDPQMHTLRMQIREELKVRLDSTPKRSGSESNPSALSARQKRSIDPDTSDDEPVVKQRSYEKPSDVRERRRRSKTPEAIRHRRETPEPIRRRSKTPEPIGRRRETPEPIRHRRETPEPIRRWSKSPEPIRRRRETPEPIIRKKRLPDNKVVDLTKGDSDRDGSSDTSDSSDQSDHRERSKEKRHREESKKRTTRSKDYKYASHSDDKAKEKTSRGQRTVEGQEPLHKQDERIELNNWKRIADDFINKNVTEDVSKSWRSVERLPATDRHQDVTVVPIPQAYIPQGVPHPDLTGMASGEHGYVVETASMIPQAYIPQGAPHPDIRGMTSEGRHGHVVETASMIPQAYIPESFLQKDDHVSAVQTHQAQVSSECFFAFFCDLCHMRLQEDTAHPHLVQRKHTSVSLYFVPGSSDPMRDVNTKPVGSKIVHQKRFTYPVLARECDMVIVCLPCNLMTTTMNSPLRMSHHIKSQHKHKQMMPDGLDMAYCKLVRTVEEITVDRNFLRRCLRQSKYPCLRCKMLFPSPKLTHKHMLKGCVTTTACNTSWSHTQRKKYPLGPGRMIALLFCGGCDLEFLHYREKEILKHLVTVHGAQDQRGDESITVTYRVYEFVKTEGVIELYDKNYVHKGHAPTTPSPQTIANVEAARVVASTEVGNQGSWREARAAGDLQTVVNHRSTDEHRRKDDHRSRENSKHSDDRKSSERSREDRKSKDGSRLRNRSRSRERSKDRDRRRSRSRSRDKSRKISRSRSRDRVQRSSRERSREKYRRRSRERSRDRDSRRSKDSDRPRDNRRREEDRFRDKESHRAEAKSTSSGALVKVPCKLYCDQCQVEVSKSNAAAHLKEHKHSSVSLYQPPGDVPGADHSRLPARSRIVSTHIISRDINIREAEILTICLSSKCQKKFHVHTSPIQMNIHCKTHKPHTYKQRKNIGEDGKSGNHFAYLKFERVLFTKEVSMKLLAHCRQRNIYKCFECNQVVSSKPKLQLHDNHMSQYNKGFTWNRSQIRKGEKIDLMFCGLCDEFYKADCAHDYVNHHMLFDHVADYGNDYKSKSKIIKLLCQRYEITKVVKRPEFIDKDAHLRAARQLNDKVSKRPQTDRARCSSDSSSDDDKDCVVVPDPNIVALPLPVGSMLDNMPAFIPPKAPAYISWSALPAATQPVPSQQQPAVSQQPTVSHQSAVSHQPALSQQQPGIRQRPVIGQQAAITQQNLTYFYCDQCREQVTEAYAQTHLKHNRHISVSQYLLPDVPGLDHKKLPENSKVVRALVFQNGLRVCDVNLLTICLSVKCRTNLRVSTCPLETAAHCDVHRQHTFTDRLSVNKNGETGNHLAHLQYIQELDKGEVAVALLQKCFQAKKVPCIKCKQVFKKQKRKSFSNHMRETHGNQHTCMFMSQAHEVQIGESIDLAFCLSCDVKFCFCSESKLVAHLVMEHGGPTATRFSGVIKIVRKRFEIIDIVKSPKYVDRNAMGDALFKFTKAWSKSGYNPAGSEGAESDGEEEDLQPSRTASQGFNRQINVHPVGGSAPQIASQPSTIPSYTHPAPIKFPSQPAKPSYTPASLPPVTATECSYLFCDSCGTRVSGDGMNPQTPQIHLERCGHSTVSRYDLGQNAKTKRLPMGMNNNEYPIAHAFTHVNMIHPRDAKILAICLAVECRENLMVHASPLEMNVMHSLFAHDKPSFRGVGKSRFALLQYDRDLSAVDIDLDVLKNFKATSRLPCLKCDASFKDISELLKHPHMQQQNRIFMYKNEKPVDGMEVILPFCVSCDYFKDKFVKCSDFSLVCHLVYHHGAMNIDIPAVSTVRVVYKRYTVLRSCEQYNLNGAGTGARLIAGFRAGNVLSVQARENERQQAIAAEGPSILDTDEPSHNVRAAKKPHPAASQHRQVSQPINSQQRPVSRPINSQQRQVSQPIISLQTASGSLLPAPVSGFTMFDSDSSFITSAVAPQLQPLSHTGQGLMHLPQWKPGLMQLPQFPLPGMIQQPILTQGLIQQPHVQPAMIREPRPPQAYSAARIQAMVEQAQLTVAKITSAAATTPSPIVVQTTSTPQTGAASGFLQPPSTVVLSQPAGVVRPLQVVTPSVLQRQSSHIDALYCDTCDMMVTKETADTHLKANNHSTVSLYRVPVMPGVSTVPLMRRPGCQIAKESCYYSRVHPRDADLLFVCLIGNCTRQSITKTLMNKHLHARHPPSGAPSHIQGDVWDYAVVKFQGVAWSGEFDLKILARCHDKGLYPCLTPRCHHMEHNVSKMIQHMYNREHHPIVNTKWKPRVGKRNPFAVGHPLKVGFCMSCDQELPTYTDQSLLKHLLSHGAKYYPSPTTPTKVMLACKVYGFQSAESRMEYIKHNSAEDAPSTSLGPQPRTASTTSTTKTQQESGSMVKAEPLVIAKAQDPKQSATTQPAPSTNTTESAKTTNLEDKSSGTVNLETYSELSIKQQLEHLRQEQSKQESVDEEKMKYTTAQICDLCQVKISDTMEPSEHLLTNNHTSISVYRVPKDDLDSQINLGGRFEITTAELFKNRLHPRKSDIICFWRSDQKSLMVHSSPIIMSVRATVDLPKDSGAGRKPLAYCKFSTTISSVEIDMLKLKQCYDTGAYPCLWCDRLFTVLPQLEEHMTLSHPPAAKVDQYLQKWISDYRSNKYPLSNQHLVITYCDSCDTELKSYTNASVVCHLVSHHGPAYHPVTQKNTVKVVCKLYTHIRSDEKLQYHKPDHALEVRETITTEILKPVSHHPNPNRPQLGVVVDRLSVVPPTSTSVTSQLTEATVTPSTSATSQQSDDSLTPATFFTSKLAEVSVKPTTSTTSKSAENSVVTAKSSASKAADDYVTPLSPTASKADECSVMLVTSSTSKAAEDPGTATTSATSKATEDSVTLGTSGTNKSAEDSVVPATSSPSKAHEDFVTSVSAASDKTAEDSMTPPSSTSAANEGSLTTPVTSATNKSADDSLIPATSFPCKSAEGSVTPVTAASSKSAEDSVTSATSATSEANEDSLTPTTVDSDVSSMQSNSIVTAEMIQINKSDAEAGAPMTCHTIITLDPEKNFDTETKSNQELSDIPAAKADMAPTAISETVSSAHPDLDVPLVMDLSSVASMTSVVSLSPAAGMSPVRSLSPGPSTSLLASNPPVTNMPHGWNLHMVTNLSPHTPTSVPLVAQTINLSAEQVENVGWVETGECVDTVPQYACDLCHKVLGLSMAECLNHMKKNQHSSISRYNTVVSPGQEPILKSVAEAMVIYNARYSCKDIVVICPVCNLIVGDPYMAAFHQGIHKRTKHGEVMMDFCRLQDTATRTVTVKDPTKPFLCEICGETFFKKFELNEHMSQSSHAVLRTNSKQIDIAVCHTRYTLSKSLGEMKPEVIIHTDRRLVDDIYFYLLDMNDQPVLEKLTYTLYRFQKIESRTLTPFLCVLHYNNIKTKCLYTLRDAKDQSKNAAYKEVMDKHVDTIR